MGFLESTRQNIRQGGTLTYAAGGITPLPIPRVGYLARIFIRVNGTMTVTPGTGTAVLSDLGPWNLIRRLRYEAGSGTQIWNTSGWGAYLMALHSRLGYQPESGLIGASFASEVYSCPVASGANAWNLGFAVALTPNERDLMGLILLQAEQTVTTLTIEWQTAGGPDHTFPVVLTGNATASFAGTATVWLETFTVPAAIEDQAPIDRVHQVTEWTQAITTVGDQVLKLLEQNIYMRVIHSVEVNGALNTDAVDRLVLRYNITDVPYDISRDFYLYYKRREWIKDFPKGVFVWDFFDQGYPNFGGDRDLVMANGLAELESILTVGTNGGALGSGNNLIRVIQEQLVPIALPTIAPTPTQ